MNDEGSLMHASLGFFKIKSKNKVHLGSMIPKRRWWLKNVFPIDIFL